MIFFENFKAFQVTCPNLGSKIFRQFPKCLPWISYIYYTIVSYKIYVQLQISCTLPMRAKRLTKIKSRVNFSCFFQAKKMKIGPLLDLWIFRAKKGKNGTIFIFFA